MTNPAMTRISREAMETKFRAILLGLGFPEEKASVLADIFTVNSLEGVYTHGVNRFPRFVQYVKDGHILVDRDAVYKSGTGNLEQWDGQKGAGPTNALLCTDRAIALAKEKGIGCVAIGYTNHWMRGGTYGWHAAKQQCAFIGWTNTLANMPAWGAVDTRLGNNPLVFGLPYKQGGIVLDMAMSQFSLGALELRQMKNETLSVPGGFNDRGELSKDPSEILSSKRVMPVGYWKGAGLSFLLDILATVLSGGLPTHKISKLDAETNVSQVFIAIALDKLPHASQLGTIIGEIIADYHQSVPVDGESQVPYPGERVNRTREENEKQGIPVLEKVWEGILKL